MKKKFFKISLLIVIVLLCCACNGNVTRDIRHAGFTVSNTFECDIFYPTNKNDNGYKKIKYLLDNNIIDEDGNIYEISLGQVYANKENCKNANTNISVKAIYDKNIVKATDNNYYYLVGSNNVASYSLIPNTDNSYELYDLLLKDNDVLKIVTADSSNGIYYVLKTDGNVYSYTVRKENYNSPLNIVDTKIIYSKSKYGKIIDFNYAGNSVSTYIKSEDSVYRMKITNYEKCSKYADVTCKYAIKKDEMFDKYKDRIIAYNGSILITDYKQMFNAQS